MNARDVYRNLKMIGAAIGAALAYILVETPGLPVAWHIGIGAFLAALGAVGLYVTPSPIHASDTPVPIPADVAGPK